MVGREGGLESILRMSGDNGTHSNLDGGVRAGVTGNRLDTNQEHGIGINTVDP